MTKTLCLIDETKQNVDNNKKQSRFFCITSNFDACDEPPAFFCSAIAFLVRTISNWSVLLFISFQSSGDNKGQSHRTSEKKSSVLDNVKSQSHCFFCRSVRRSNWGWINRTRKYDVNYLNCILKWSFWTQYAPIMILTEATTTKKTTTKNTVLLINKPTLSWSQFGDYFKRQID